MLLQYLALLESDHEKDFFTDIYKKHRTELYFKAYNIVHNAEDAEDMVQETFLSLIRNVDKVINEKPHKVWFYMETIVKNRSLNLLKRRKIQETPGLDETWMQDEIMEKGPDILMEEFEEFASRCSFCIVNNFPLYSQNMFAHTFQVLDLRSNSF